MTSDHTRRMFADSVNANDNGSERKLTFVLAELMLARAERDRLYALIGNDDPTPAEDVRIDELEDQIWLREDEAKALIERATGVPFDAIQSANL